MEPHLIEPRLFVLFLHAPKLRHNKFPRHSVQLFIEVQGFIRTCSDSKFMMDISPFFKPLTLKRWAAAAIWLLTFPVMARADHAMGGEVSYTYLGNGDFEIIVYFYRECYENGLSGNNLDQQITLGIFEGNDTYDLVNVNLDNSTTDQVDNILENPCGNLPPDLCMQRLEYRTVVNLPPSAEGYDLVFERCCRNSGIINIPNPQTIGIGLTTQIPPFTDDSNPNSSPIFNTYPPAGLCANFEFFLDQSATDSDGDSLVYSFCTPWNGGSQNDPTPLPNPAGDLNTIPWANGFSATDPITANPNFSIDPQTGQITGFPTQLGAFVIGICVSEYRDGVWLSTVKRDFQLNVVNCDPTIVSAVTPQSDNQLCVGETISFTENSIGAQAYLWDFGVAGLTTDVSSDPAPSYTFPDTGIYDVTLIVNPDWPCADTSVTTFYVYEPLDLSIEVTDYECFGNGVEAFQLTGDGAFNTNSSVSWTLPAGNPAAATLTTPWIEVPAGSDWSANFYAQHYGCESDVDFEWEAPVAPTAGVEDQSSFCNGLDFDFTNESSYATEYWWDFGVANNNNDVSTAENPSYSYPIFGDYQVMLVASTPFACPDTAYASVSIDPPLNPLFSGAESDCFSAHSIDLMAEGGNPDNAVYTWDFGGAASTGAASNLQISGLQYDAPGNYSISLSVQANGCEEIHNEEVQIVEDPTINFTASNTSGCPPLTVQFTNTSTSETATSYLWNFGDGDQSVQASPSHVYDVPGTYTVSLSMGTSGNCVATLNLTEPGLIGVSDPPAAGFDITPNAVDILDPVVEVIYLGAPGNDVYYSMGDGGGLTTASGFYTYSDGGVFDVVQTVVDPYGCASTAHGQVAVSGSVIYSPSAFSPNNDGINDAWLPVALGVTDFKLEIYDRWGDRVWFSEDRDTPWQGQHESGNHYVQDGTYTWVLRVEDDLRNPQVYSGQVLIFR
jgi:gliding motility-associated-like protein